MEHRGTLQRHRWTYNGFVIPQNIPTEMINTHVGRVAKKALIFCKSIITVSNSGKSLWVVEFSKLA